MTTTQSPLKLIDNEEPCDPKDIALKSFFLGPQSENANLVQYLIERIFSRWFEWRKHMYPNDGRAISLADQNTPEFIQRQTDFSSAMDRLLTSLEKEVPKFSPRYIGHMFSEISLPALLGHIATVLHNPNIISGESARVGVVIEDQAIAALSQMIGYPSSARGHFTSGGTLANFEALIRARNRSALWLAQAAATKRNSREIADDLVQVSKTQLRSLFYASHMGWSTYSALNTAQQTSETSTMVSPREFHPLEENPFIVGQRLQEVFETPYKGPVILVPQNKHYSWQKGVSLLGLGQEAFWPVQLDEHGRMDLQDLRANIAAAEQAQRPILMVVSVAGTTELGQFDPVDGVQDLLDELRETKGLHIWHHVDAAYGAFFCTIDERDVALEHSDMNRALRAIARADSVTLDPHKLGYVPYASGTFLTKEAPNYLVNAHSAPYIQYNDSDKGPYTIEGSRPATGAAATWMTAQTIGLDANGYGRILARTIRVKENLQKKLLNTELPVRVAPGCESNVLCFNIAYAGESLERVNARMKRLFERFSPNRQTQFTLSKTTLHEASYKKLMHQFVQSWRGIPDTDEVVLLRACMLNPFFDSHEMNLLFSDEFIHSLRKALATEI